MNGLRLGSNGYRWTLTMTGFEDNESDACPAPEEKGCCAQQASPQSVQTAESVAHARFLALPYEEKVAAVQEGLTPLAKAHAALLNVDWATIVRLAVQGGIGLAQGILQAIFAGTQAPAPLPNPAPVPTGK